jgi:exopolysaccharide production protein ExoZ
VNYVIPAGSKIESVQCLRGLAALAVVICHYASAMPGYPQLSNIFSFGQLGVHIFFFISGFVILLSLIKNNYKHSQFFRFLIKRSVRIDPTYIIVILLTLLSFYILSLLPSFKGHAIPFIPEQFLAHVFYIVPFTKWTYYNHVFWTLSVEFQFYVLVGSLFFLSGSQIYRSVLIVLLALSVFIPVSNNYYLIIAYGPLFALGMSGLLYYMDRKAINILIPLFCLLIAGISYGILVCGLLTACGLFVLFNTRVPEVLYFLGEISYSLYLIHALVLVFFNGIFKTLGFDLNIYPLFWLVIKLVAALAVSVVIHYLFEKPFIRLSKRIRFTSN